jgi:hypothetical protein
MAGHCEQPSVSGAEVVAVGGELEERVADIRDPALVIEPAQVALRPALEQSVLQVDRFVAIRCHRRVPSSAESLPCSSDTGYREFTAA